MQKVQKGFLIQFFLDRNGSMFVVNSKPHYRGDAVLSLGFIRSLYIMQP